MQTTSLQATDRGGDVLLARATVDTLEAVSGSRDRVSATTNHYDSTDHAAAGNRNPKATPRSMTADEAAAAGRSA